MDMNRTNHPSLQPTNQEVHQRAERQQQQMGGMAMVPPSSASSSTAAPHTSVPPPPLYGHSNLPGQPWNPAAAAGTPQLHFLPPMAHPALAFYGHSNLPGQPWNPAAAAGTPQFHSAGPSHGQPTQPQQMLDHSFMLPPPAQQHNTNKCPGCVALVLENAELKRRLAHYEGAASREVRQRAEWQQQQMGGMAMVPPSSASSSTAAPHTSVPPPPLYGHSNLPGQPWNPAAAAGTPQFHSAGAGPSHGQQQIPPVSQPPQELPPPEETYDVTFYDDKSAKFTVWHVKKPLDKSKSLCFVYQEQLYTPNGLANQLGKTIDNKWKEKTIVTWKGQEKKLGFLVETKELPFED